MKHHNASKTINVWYHRINEDNFVDRDKDLREHDEETIIHKDVDNHVTVTIHVECIYV